MPVPAVQECHLSMSKVRTSAGDIEDAIDAVKRLADDETWSGPAADTWTGDFDCFASDAKNSLGTPLEDAIDQCQERAAEIQRESAGG